MSLKAISDLTTIKEPQAISELDLSGLDIKWGIWHVEEAKVLEQFTRLSSLNLSKNNIDFVPIDFSKLPDLTILNLSENDLGYWGRTNQFDIGGEWEALSKLEVLNLNDNDIGYVHFRPHVKFLNSLKVSLP